MGKIFNSSDSDQQPFDIEVLRELKELVLGLRSNSGVDVKLDHPSIGCFHVKVEEVMLSSSDPKLNSRDVSVPRDMGVDADPSSGVKAIIPERSYTGSGSLGNMEDEAIAELKDRLSEKLSP